MPAPMLSLYPPPYCVPVSQLTISAAIAEALRIYQDPNSTQEEVDRSIYQIKLRLTCLEEPLHVRDAARLHLAFGLSLFSQGAREEARPFFSAARGLDPSVVSEVEAWKITPLTAAVKASDPPALSDQVPLPPVTGAIVLVDGLTATALPRSVPALVQLSWDSDERVHWTGYITPDAPPLQLSRFGPPTPGAKQECPPQLPCPAATPCPPPERTVSRWLAASAVASTGASLALYGLSVGQYADFWGGDLVDQRSQEDLTAIGERATLLQRSALGVGGVAAALDVWLLVQVFRDPEAPERVAEGRSR